MKNLLWRRGRRLTVLGSLCLLPSAAACNTAGSSTIGSSDGGADAAGTAQRLDPGRKDIHRLNSTEYNATIQDVLGTKLQPANGSWRGG